MIDNILSKVNEKFGSELSQITSLDRSSIPQALQVISSTVLKKAKSYLDNGQLMEIKDVFMGGDKEKKTQYMNDMKQEIETNLSDSLGIDAETATTLTERAVPEIIQIAKEELLGPDGKFGLTDIPRLMSFIKSEGKEAKAGGIGGLFGF